MAKMTVKNMFISDKLLDEMKKRIRTFMKKLQYINSLEYVITMILDTVAYDIHFFL